MREARVKMDELTKQVESFDGIYKEMVEMFGDEPGAVRPEDFFKDMNTFINDFQVSIILLPMAIWFSFYEKTCEPLN